MPRAEVRAEPSQPTKALASRLYIGCAGWSYPKGKGTWDGVFYPPKLADKDKLAYYAEYFNTVEINSSFYRPPNKVAAKAWAAKVPEDFRFTAKVWQKFTHPKMFEKATGDTWRVADADFDVFLQGIGPLAEAGRLGPLLAQFPTSFRPDSGALEYLEDLVRRMRGAGLADSQPRCAGCPAAGPELQPRPHRPRSGVGGQARRHGDRARQPAGPGAARSVPAGSRRRSDDL